MTDAEALTLTAGDRIRLRPAPGQAPPQRSMFIVSHIEQRHGDVRIVSTEGFRFVPWEVDKVEPVRRP